MITELYLDIGNICTNTPCNHNIIVTYNTYYNTNFLTRFPFKGTFTISLFSELKLKYLYGFKKCPKSLMK